jgi:regulator of protease activity HflC (stomatin/prohibitin superfamily)
MSSTGDNMKKLMWLMFIGVLAIGCTRVDPGHVGIKVYYYGSQKGVDDFPAVTGMVWYNPMATSVFQFPTFVQTAVWTHNKNEGSPLNEELSFNSREGLVFNADISLSYRLDPSKVPHFYVTFRSDDLDKFTHGFLRNIARDAFNEVAVKYTAEEIYGDKKEAILTEVRQRINAQTTVYGVVVEQFGFVGAPRPPQNVVDAINAKIKATQDAIRVENELRSATAEAKKAVAAAQGRAQAVLVEAEAQAKANTLLSQSLSAQLIQQKAIDKWNGTRPLVEGSNSGLLLNIPLAK